MATRILIAYDGSETARRAAEEGAALARALSAEIHLVNVVDDARDRQGLTIAADQETRVEHAQDVTGALVRELFEGLAWGVHVEQGSAGPAIVACADENDVDVIVVGNKRVQGIERVLGSVAIHVLRHASCSVYVAHTT
ncbi:MAG: universal stress protein [Acidimicrobiales bacterium]